MALEKKIIGLPIAKGTNEKISDRVLPLGELADAKNVQFLKGGEAKKRKGFWSLSNTVPALSDSATTVSVGKAVAAYGDEVLAFDGRYGYTKTSDDDNWVNKGTVVGCTLERERTAADSNLVQTATQITQSGDFEVHVWSEIDPSETTTRTVDFTSVTPKAPTTIGAITYDPVGGSALNDMSTGGTYTNTERLLYEIVLNTTGTPDIFQWRTQNDAGTWGSYATLNCTTTPQTLNEGVTVQFAANTGHTRLDAWRFYAGYGAVDINGATDHNFSPGGKVTEAFVHADWTDGDYRVSAVTSTSAYTLDFTGKPAPEAATAGTGTLINAHSWRTYAKVIDKTTRAEIVGKKLINLFVTNNSVHNVPRAQVLSIGRFVYIFVHVGSGRVKHLLLDTNAGLSSTIVPGAALTDGASGVTFSVDQTYPHWHVAPTNYIEGASANGFVLLRRLDDTGQKLRLSTWKANASTGVFTGGGEGEQSTPEVVKISDAIHFHDPNLMTSAGSSSTEEYTTDTEQIEVAGGLMLSVVRPHGSSNDLYVCVGYTKSGDFSSGVGTADEPNGVMLNVYDSDLDRLGASNLATIDGGSTSFVDASASGYLLLNGCAGVGARQSTDNKIRFFVTMIKNTTAMRQRSQRHLICSYDLLTNGSTGITDNDIDLHWCTITGDAFYYNSDFYFTAGYAARGNDVDGDFSVNTFNNSVEMLLNQHGEVVAKGASSAGPWTQDINFRFLSHREDSVTYRLNFMQTLPRVIAETADKFRFGSSVYSGVNIGKDGAEITAMDAGLSTVDMAPTRYLPSVEANGALMLAGGILWNYSGDYFKEQNFFWWPEIHSFAESAGTVDAGSHAWVAIYEWVDTHGKIQRSNPSMPVIHSVTSGGKKVTFQVYTLQLTYKKDLTASILPGGVAANYWGGRSEAKIVLYRTSVNDTGGGAIYYRCAEALVDNTVPWQEVVDNLPDASLIDNGVLYTTGGNAGHICPPSQYDIALWKDRVFLATTENTVWFSKRFSENRETGFSDSFIRSVDNRSEKIRALCPNLEHLLIFGERNGYYMSGDGPSDSGAGPGFSPLRVFAPGQGALDGTCRVETPAGVFFQTRQGLMLCARNMQVTPKGAKVEDQVTFQQYAIDGHVFQKEHEVRFLIAGTSHIAVYNYLFDQWTTWQLHADTGTNAGSVVVDGDYYRLNTVGVLYKQQTTTYYDKVVSALKPYQFLLGTGWINVGQLQQLGRVYQVLFLGDYNAASSPRLLLYTDYSTSATTVSMSSPPGTSKFQLAAKLPKQKVKALKFQIAEDTPGAGGDVMSIQSFALLVGLKKPGTSFKLPAANQISGG